MNEKPKRSSSGGNPRVTSGGAVALTATKTVFGTVGRLLATMIMVGIITGCIVACILTVYILKYVGADNEIDLDQYRLGYTSIMYAYDDNGNEVELQRLYFGGENRIWVDYEDINQYTKDAIVAVEDKRFWEHDGVDWKRTIGAGLNLFIPLSGTTSGGGSTITQQLIKNITQDNDLRVERKVREIFRALNLSKRYSREQILETYLNVVPFGNGTNGIQSAANLYFDKNAKDLTLAESAAIVGITQFPGRYDPFVNPELNKQRQEHILDEMLKQELISQQQYTQAKNETLNFQRNKHFESLQVTQSYFVDHVIEEVISDLMEYKGYTYAFAEAQLYQGGYRIYTTVDLDIQAHLEEVFSSSENFPPVYNEIYPQSASVITDPNGKVVAMVGGIGEKEGARVLNRATQSMRQPGSAIKPLATYALAFEYDRITWSTMIEDGPMTIPTSSGTSTMSWPSNYYGGYDGMMTVDTAIQRSTNTIPAKLADALTPRRVFDFLYNDLHMHSLVERVVVDGAVSSDITLSAMALGGMTYGVTPMEMAGGYQIYLNGGVFTEPYTYTEIRDSQGNMVLSKDTTPTRVIGEDTSVVINKLLQRVVTGPRGTGVQANLGTMPTAGKTGTSTDDVDQWFIGLTPYYVCQTWLGYDRKLPENNYGQIRYGTYGPPVLWKTIMQPIHEDLEYMSFYDSDSVVSMEYCTISGDIATSNCGSRGTGWYKRSKIPGNCTGHVSAEDADRVTESGNSSGDSSGNSGSGGNSGGGSTSSEPPSIFDRMNND